MHSGSIINYNFRFGENEPRHRERTGKLAVLLLEIKAAVEAARSKEQSSLPDCEQLRYSHHYDDILEQAERAARGCVLPSTLIFVVGAKAGLFSAVGIRVRFKRSANRIDYLIIFEIADLLWWSVSKTIVSSLFRTGKSNRRRMDFWYENVKNVLYLPRTQSESPAGFSRG